MFPGSFNAPLPWSNWWYWLLAVVLLPLIAVAYGWLLESGPWQ